MSLGVKTKDKEIVVGFDKDKDGVNSAELILNLGEAAQEALKRGESVKGQKLVDYSISLTELKLSLDANKDGEDSLQLKVNTVEALKEFGISK